MARRNMSIMNSRNKKKCTMYVVRRSNKKKFAWKRRQKASKYAAAQLKRLLYPFQTILGDVNLVGLSLLSSPGFLKRLCRLVFPNCFLEHLKSIACKRSPIYHNFEGTAIFKEKQKLNLATYNNQKTDFCSPFLRF